jgi:hypothetical protein
MSAKNDAVVSISVRIPKPLAERIARIAHSNDRTVGQECARILRLVVAPSLAAGHQ